MPRTDIPACGMVETLVASAARTTSGNSGTISGFNPSRPLRVQLNVTAASGTTPSMAVTVEDTLDGSNFNTIGSFTAKTAVSREVVNIAVPFSPSIRVSWAITGTTPSFTFSVVAAY